jgi:branched-chain amino acid transport system substrate-binding protein
MRTTCNVARCLLLFTLLALSIAACGGNGGGGATGSQTIVIGTTLPLTGPLASVGVILKAAYQAAIDDANAAGGIDVQGTKQKINLKQTIRLLHSTSRITPLRCLERSPRH